MRRKLYIGLILVLMLLISACTTTDQQTDGTIQTLYEEPSTETSGDTITLPPTTNTTEGTQGETYGDDVTVPTTMPPTETMPEETETTAPLHSELYLPQYTTQQMLEFFSEVVLSMEYADGTGNPSLVQKWTKPIGYRIYGTPTEEDEAVLTALFTQLNAVSGFSGIYLAEKDVPEDLSISFLDPDAFVDKFSYAINDEDAYGAAQFWYYTDTNEIHTARIGCRTDLDQITRNSVLVEEIINSLGISDTILRPDSIVYQYSDENTTLSDVDWVILKLLYHPSILCGMGADGCVAIIQELYY